MEFIAFERRTQCRKMKESFFIDMYAAKNGVMNQEMGHKKIHAGTRLSPFSIKFEVMVSNAHAID